MMASIVHTEPWGGGSQDDTPLVPGTLRGYRVMTVQAPRLGPDHLQLWGGWTHWPRNAMTAKCLKRPNDPGQLPYGIVHFPACERSPGLRCHCGIFHAYRPAVLDQVQRPDAHWIAVTASHGRIIWGSLGFRAAHTQLVALAPRFAHLTLGRGAVSSSDYVPWVDQVRYLQGRGLQLYNTLTDLLNAYPPDDLSVLRPDARAA